MPKYVFKELTIIKAADKADPQRIGEALTSLAGDIGSLTPHAVVDVARPPKSLLHKHFEWDNQAAADAYRLDQARSLIRAIRVEDDEASDGFAPAFVSITEKSGTSYRTITAVRANVDLQTKVLAAAERDLQAWQNRYQSLVDVCKVVREAQDMITKKRGKKQTNESRAQA